MNEQPWKVEPWGKSWMVMRPGPVGFAQYIRSPSGNVKFFRRREAAESAARAKNTESAGVSGGAA